MSEARANLVDQLRELFEAGHLEEGLALTIDLHPADVADLLRHLPEEAEEAYFKALDSEKGAEVLSEMDESRLAGILPKLTPAELAALLLNMDSDDAADILSEVPPDVAAEALTRIDKEDQQEVRKLLTYPEDSAGGLMQMEVATIPQDVSIAEAMNILRNQAKKVEDFQNVFVFSGDRQVVGFLTLRELLLAKPDRPVSELMNPVPVIIHPEDDQEEVARLFQKYDLISAPVLDAQGRLLGRVTVDDVVDVIQEEASEDFYRMVGSDDEELAYGERVFKISGIRLPWILTNLVGGLIAGWILWHFKVTLAEALVLVSFVPVINATGGNVGTQTATVFVRSIALGHYPASRLGRVLLRELRVAGVMGVICGALAGGAAALWHGRPSLGLIVTLAMVIDVPLAALIGIMAPAFFRRMKIDPAIASGPLVTTANDNMGILIYLGIATIFLRYVLR